MKGILSYSEKSGLAQEVSEAANELGVVSGGSVLSIELDTVRTSVRCDRRILLLNGERQLFEDPELSAAAILQACTAKQPALILLGNTRQGREIAAKLSVDMKAGTLTGVSDLRFDGERITGNRSVYGGRFSAKVSSSLPCIATIPEGAYPARTGSSDVIETIRVETPSPRVTRLEIKPKAKGSANLRGASIVVSAGRGIKKKEDLLLIERLAKAMGGVVGGSRPMSSDLGWLGEETHIGLTGITVSPDLYVAIGISGQLQHVAGIRNSKIIVAINTDSEAPIFESADYGIIGDLYEIVPALLSILDSEESSSS